MALLQASLILLVVLTAIARDIAIPSIYTVRSAADKDVVLNTIPCSYTQAQLVIEPYNNIAWSDGATHTATFGDHTSSTAMACTLTGLQVGETMVTHSKPPSTPSVKVQSATSIAMMTSHIGVYVPSDGAVVMGICGDRSTLFKFTAQSFARQSEAGGQVSHKLDRSSATRRSTASSNNPLPSLSANNAPGGIDFAKGYGIMVGAIGLFAWLLM